MSKSDNELVVKAKPSTGFVNEIQRSDWIDLLTIIGPDLKLELPPDWITPTPPVSGQSATIRFCIRNVGQRPALDFKTHLYMDGVQVGSWEFHHIDHAEDPANQYQPLPPGQATRTFEYVTPPLKGTHVFRWVVDAEKEVLEQSEGNNEFESSITWVTNQQLPDLVARIIEPTGPVEIGQEATLKVKVTNQGQTDVVQPFWVFVKSNGMHIITKEIPKLKAYESVILEKPIISVSIENSRIDVEVDVYNEINESNKNNNTHTMDLAFAAVDLELTGCRVVPSLQHNGRPVISIDIRNNGKVDARRPFSVHIYEINGGVTPQVDIIQLSNKQLPKAGETLTIILPITGWDFETRKIYIATKAERQFVLKVDPEFVYQKTLASNSQILIKFCLYDVYKPWFQASENTSGDLPNAYFFMLPGTGLPNEIQKRTFAVYVEIPGRPGNGGSSGGIGIGPSTSGINLWKTFEKIGEWIESLFNDPADDKVRDVINRHSPYYLRALEDYQLVDMIEELFDGPTTAEDENAVNKVLDALPAKKFGSVVAKLGGLSAIDDEIDGQPWKNTLKIVSEKGQQLLLTEDKLSLIKGLLDTTTYDAEEKTIIDLVKSMSVQQRWEMIQKPGFSKDDFDDDVDNDEWDQLEKLLDQAKPVLKNDAITLLESPEVSKIDFELEGRGSLNQILNYVVDTEGFGKVKKIIGQDKITFIHDPTLPPDKAAYKHGYKTLRMPQGSTGTNYDLQALLVHELTHVMHFNFLPPGTTDEKYRECAAYVAQALYVYYLNEASYEKGTLTPLFPHDVYLEAWYVAMKAIKKKKLTEEDYADLLKEIEVLLGLKPKKP